MVVPLGAVEAHGPHLPIGTDCYVANGLAQAVAGRVGAAVVAPTISVAYAPRTNYPGTISVHPRVVWEIVERYCHAAVELRMRSVVLLPAHAESFQATWLFAPELGERFPALRVVPFLSMEEFMRVRNEVIDRYGLTVAEGGWHAGASETSVMMALHPEMVRSDRLKTGFVDDPAPRVSDSITYGFRDLNADGIFGDPTKARADIGRAIVAALVDAFLDGVGNVLDRSPQASTDVFADGSGNAHDDA
jgi:creatinine amidohydrolase